MELIEIIEVPEANDMPFYRWCAYMHCAAISLGYHGRYCIGKLNGMSRIKVFE